MSEQVILALETSLDGGSVALLLSGKTVYRKTEHVSRAAELIGAIDVAFMSVNLSANDLDLIAVSTGPGSFTGIRVGISTALGLARSLEIPVSGISLFDAIAFSNPMDNSEVVIPLGRGRFGVQSFPCDRSVVKPESDPTSMMESELLEKIFNAPSSKFLIYGEDLLVGSETMSRIPPNVSFIDENLAVLIAKRATTIELPGELSPIYLSR